MSIWGRRDSEPAEQTPETESTARADEAQAPAAGPEHQGEPERAFWRAQGEAVAHGGAAARGETTARGEAAVPDEAMPPREAAVPGGATAQGESAAPTGPAPAQAPPPASGQMPAAPASANDDAGPVEGKAAQGGISPQRWSEILMTFVDDPRGSVTMAADAVDAAIDEFVTSLRARQGALASSWQSTETDTEQLRVALRDYRKFWHQMRHLDLPGKAG